jgi:hypothetical protein
LIINVDNNVDATRDVTHAVNWNNEASTAIGTALDPDGNSYGYFNGAIGYVGIWAVPLKQRSNKQWVIADLPILDFAMTEGAGATITSRTVPKSGTQALQARLVLGAGWHRVSKSHGVDAVADLLINANVEYDVAYADEKTYTTAKAVAEKADHPFKYTGKSDLNIKPTSTAMELFKDAGINVDCDQKGVFAIESIWKASESLGEHGAVLASIQACGQTIGTSGEWKCMDKKTYDKENKGDQWKTVAYDDSHWNAAAVTARTVGQRWEP